MIFFSFFASPKILLVSVKTNVFFLESILSCNLKLKWLGEGFNVTSRYLNYKRLKKLKLRVFLIKHLRYIKILRKGTGKRGHIVADTLLLMMFLGRANALDTL